MTFLEVLTRYYSRPVMLARNQVSIMALGDGVEHTLLPDEVGRGIGWATENMADYAPNLVGEYIWVLDDDDECIRSELVTELRGIRDMFNPDVVMVKMDHGPRGILPDIGYWEQPPVCGHIGVSAFIVRRAVWQAYAWAWRSGSYVSDFIKAVFDSRTRIYWHDVVASRVQRISFGAPE